MNIVLHIAYEGTKYQGFTPGITSVLEKSLSLATLSHTPLQAASRTDAGVHARDQVVNFSISHLPFPLEKLPLVLNRTLPRDIRILSAHIAPPTFHATLDAKSKEYHYNVDTAPVESPFTCRFAWHYPHPLDRSLIEEGCLAFVGTKNFTSFVNQGSDRETTPLTTITKCAIEGQLRFVIHGSHFHYKMVRNIVGTLLYIGAGKIALQDLKNILFSCDRRLSGITAPAHGLVLNKVHY